MVKTQTKARTAVVRDRHAHALSPREREIVRLVARGMPNKQIGAELSMSPWTVGSHLRLLYAKCGVASRAALVAVVLGHGDELAADLSARSPKKR